MVHAMVSFFMFLWFNGFLGYGSSPYFAVVSNWMGGASLSLSTLAAGCTVGVSYIRVWFYYCVLIC
jgi:hypothetical protein